MVVGFPVGGIQSDAGKGRRLDVSDDPLLQHTNKRGKKVSASCQIPDARGGTPSLDPDLPLPLPLPLSLPLRLEAQVGGGQAG